jgi:hypothetical protein
MTIITVKTGGIAADAVTDAKIADDVVGTEHLTANEVDTAALKGDAVTGAELADNAVNSEHYTDGSIDTAHIADVNVTQGKIADQAINEAKMQISNAPTNGYMLTAQSGNTGGMTWAEAGGGSWNLISTTTISDDSTVTISGMDSTYKNYVIIGNNLHPATDAVDLRGGAIIGGSLHTGSASYFSIVEHSRTGNANNEFDNQEQKAFWTFNDTGEDIGNANEDSVNLILHIFNPSDTTFEKFIKTEINYLNAAVHHQFSRGYGINTLDNTAAFTGIQFYFSSGNMATGTIKLFGLS